MSRQDKWSLFMIVFTIIIGIAGLATGIEPGQLPGFLFGAFLVYWMGTAFIKDKPKETQSEPKNDEDYPPVGIRHQ